MGSWAKIIWQVLCTCHAPGAGSADAQVLDFYEWMMYGSFYIYHLMILQLKDLKNDLKLKCLFERYWPSAYYECFTKLVPIGLFDNLDQ